MAFHISSSPVTDIMRTQVPSCQQIECPAPASSRLRDIHKSSPRRTSASSRFSGRAKVSMADFQMGSCGSRTISSSVLAESFQWTLFSESPGRYSRISCTSEKPPPGTGRKRMVRKRLRSGVGWGASALGSTITVQGAGLFTGMQNSPSRSRVQARLARQV
jgi:hypothetical protein